MISKLWNWFVEAIKDMVTNDKLPKGNCRTYKHPNGYTNVSICNCKYPKH